MFPHLLERTVPDRLYYFAHKLFSGNVEYTHPRIFSMNVMAHGMHKVRLSKPHAAVNKEGVINFTRVIRNGLGSGGSKTIIWPYYKFFKNISRVKFQILQCGLGRFIIFEGNLGRSNFFFRRGSRLLLGFNRRNRGLPWFYLNDRFLFRLRLGGVIRLKGGFGIFLRVSDWRDFRYNRWNTRKFLSCFYFICCNGFGLLYNLDYLNFFYHIYVRLNFLFFRCGRRCLIFFFLLF